VQLTLRHSKNVTALRAASLTGQRRRPPGVPALVTSLTYTMVHSWARVDKRTSFANAVVPVHLVLSLIQPTSRRKAGSDPLLGLYYDKDLPLGLQLCMEENRRKAGSALSTSHAPDIRSVAPTSSMSRSSAWELSTPVPPSKKRVPAGQPSPRSPCRRAGRLCIDLVPQQPTWRTGAQHQVSAPAR